MRNQQVTDVQLTDISVDYLSMKYQNINLNQ